jgi:hypothetical protein
MPVEHPRVQGDRTEELELPQAVSMLADECRMVLPGVQALFGFQLIAVFSDGFSEKLSQFDQQLHLAAIVLVVVAIGMLMAPAAYHRQTSPMHVSHHLVRVSTRLLMWGLLPLALALSVDLYVVSRLVTGGGAAALLAAAMLGVLCLFWYLLPRVKGLQNVLGRK